MSSFPSLLAGIRVLDASRVLAGPFCGQLLADLGADVIKIERPGQGDDTRTWGPPFLRGEVSAYYLSCNRGKRGLALDLARPEGREVFARLARSADVVLENFLPSAARKLGLTPDQLHPINPRLVVCSISGFGRTGPWADLPGYDFAIQALSGLMSVTGQKGGQPTKVGVALADVLTGLYAAAAVLACLVARGKSGHGYAIDLSLLDCATAAQVNLVQGFLTRVQDGVPPAEAAPGLQGNAHLQIVPYQLFATADGWLVLACGNDSQWKSLTQSVAPELWSDERLRTNPGRVRHREELTPRLENLFRTKKTSEWEAILEGAGVPCAPLWSYADLFRQPIAEARGLKVTVTDPQGRPVDLCGCPVRVDGAQPQATCPPELGQHTDAILREAGLTQEQIIRLRESGIV
jgi:crotonobetainyl-CoA:carnitine CoA-transferase CaiB-like acyl-CoA transferase